MREREAAEPGTQQDEPGTGEPVRGFGGRRPSRQRRHDRRSGRRTRGPPGSDDGGHDGEDHRRRDRPPLQVESIDPVIDESLERGARRKPGREAQDHAGDGADDSDNGSVGNRRQANMAVGRAERAQHAERPEPALRHDGETRGGEEADEQETNRLQREHDDRGGGLVHGRAASDAHCVPARAERVEFLLEASNRIVT